ncbi:cytochrome P450 76A1-like [Tasmannia lanceolata]|uniref:cytochrome P450 76A1-like n=1 Tax=Tasmannia lanceolata TaxID=3420 RepID=UPI00406392A2
MEWTSEICLWSTFFSLSAALLLLFALGRHKSHLGSMKLPPGPRGWPIVGNMFDLGAAPLHTLAGLGQKYGPIVQLRLGAVNTVVILSTEAATEFFKNHDLSFVNRTITEAMKSCCYDQGSLALAEYGPYWRMLRRLCAQELFVTGRLNETVDIRERCVDDMIRWIAEEAGNTGGVEVAHFVFLMSFNLLGNLIFSRDLLDPNSSEGAKFFRLTERVMQWGGKPNLADFFPSLRWLDPQGIRKKMERDLGGVLDIAAGFVKEHIENRRLGLGQENRKKNFLDVLLESKGDGKDEPAKISNRDLNILILEIFMAATDTTTSTIEWAMTELLCNPGSMSKVQDELARVVGRNRKVEERDIEELRYLQAVVKETLRLHPPIPFLVPRKALKDTNLMGYTIRKDTQVFMHVWAIGRDPASWDDPLCFKPERFLDSDIDYRGHNFQFMPFGAGRRMCAGVPLANRVLPLVLGSLLHCFDWVLAGNITPETMDMEERMGITLRKATPLKVLPKPHTV